MPEPVVPKTILVVEDDASTARMVGSALKYAGFIATCESKRSEVLALLSAKPFDVIITDVIMPEIDGYEVMLAARKYQPSTPIIAMSGGGVHMTSEASLKIAQSIGALVVLVKPFQVDELLDAVATALSTRKPPETPRQPPES